MAENSMVQGMTGFGSAERGGFRVEVRSLNHRYLEMSVKLPPALGRHEMAVRDAVKRMFERGKLDVYISTTGQERIRLRLNLPLAREIAAALNSLCEELSIRRDMGIEAMLAWKDILITEETEYETDAMFEALDDALAGVMAMRAQEGGEIMAGVMAGAERMERLNREVVSLCPEAAEAAKKRFSERAKAFLSAGEFPLSEDAGINESKLIHEAARAAEKVDIKEEVERIEGHLGYLRKILGNGGKIGRTLDFILQELYREANTISSKAEEQRVVRAAVAMKAEIEGMREQIQNIQ
ncbi:MAG: YicC/YloC family endoribonuclease [Thermodesulfovibrionales bacterium]|nr:YicC/YloC family endoribonuclease [Thermodesulfovibrionales bacterium]